MFARFFSLITKCSPEQRQRDYTSDAEEKRPKQAVKSGDDNREATNSFAKYIKSIYSHYNKKEFDFQNMNLIKDFLL